MKEKSTARCAQGLSLRSLQVENFLWARISATALRTERAKNGVGERPGTRAERARGGDHDGEQGCDGRVHEPEVAPAVDEPRNHTRAGEALRGELPEGAHDGGRIRARRALGRALRAAVAMPDLAVGDETVLQPEPDEGHLPAGEEPLVAGEVAGRGAGPALQA